MPGNPTFLSLSFYQADSGMSQAFIIDMSSILINALTKHILRLCSFLFGRGSLIIHIGINIHDTLRQARAADVI